MRIAHLSPLYESVPPKRYGGTQRVIHWLIEESVKLGHEVTLYGTGDCQTSAQLRAICQRGLREMECMEAAPGLHLLLTERLKREIAEFDVVHSHLEYLAYPALRDLSVPHLSTLHSRLDTIDQLTLHAEFAEVPLVSISEAQRRPLPEAHWLKTIYHGIPLELYRQGDGSGDYLVFIGRVCPDKGPARAAEIAERSGLKLLMAAKVDREFEDYYENAVKPHLKNAEFLGEIDDADKQQLLGNARALLFPIDWPEPFGLVMIESMACGTPVIGWRCGSVPEVIDEGITGFVVDSIEEAVARVEDCKSLDRSRCRAHFESRFSALEMTKQYIELYNRLIVEYHGLWRGTLASSPPPFSLQSGSLQSGSLQSGALQSGALQSGVTAPVEAAAAGNGTVVGRPSAGVARTGT